MSYRNIRIDISKEDSIVDITIDNKHLYLIPQEVATLISYLTLINDNKIPYNTQFTMDLPIQE
jgi:hypothetical protein